MIADKSGRMLTGVQQRCANCPECDPLKLEIVLFALAETTSIVNIVGVMHVNGPTYAVAVAGARLEFVWSEPYASDLNLICPEVTE